MIKTCPAYNPDTHRPVDSFDEAPDGAGGLQLVQQIAPLPRDIIVARRLADVDAERDRRIALGVEFAGKRISMNDTSRTDLSGMATTAALVLAGALPWPDSYAQGWIAMDNTRVPLPTPTDGIALAATVAAMYSELVQHARSLKDAVVVAENPWTINILADWPV